MLRKKPLAIVCRALSRIDTGLGNRDNQDKGLFMFAKFNIEIYMDYIDYTTKKIHFLKVRSSLNNFFLHHIVF
jgi:hypothetical protein